MNKKQLLAVGAAALLLFSCSFEGDLGSSSTFWTLNFQNNRHVSINAQLLAEGRHCIIWAEKGVGVSVEQAQRVASQFDNVIFPRLIAGFSPEGGINDPETGEIFENIMEWASGDDQGRLTILLLRIRDGYDPPDNRSFVAGYFSSLDFFDAPFSNRRDIIYIDTKVQRPDSSAAYETIAHEMQHLMNFAFTLLYRTGSSYINYMDTWVDEGLSAAAEWVYSREYSETSLRWYARDTAFFQGLSGLISQGNNFYAWNSRANEDPYAILDDYATVYLFFQWLRLQEGRSSVYSDIISSPFPDYRSVVNAMSGYNNWANMLRDWLAANYINAPDGPHGYLNEPRLRDIQAPIMTSTTGYASLYPGEGVYSRVLQGGSISSSPSDGPNIRYAGLGDAGLSTATTTTGGALLTYNINTNENGNRESGTLASVSAGTSSIDTAPARSAAPSRPFAISAGDMLRRNGHEQNHELDVARLIERLRNRE